MVGLCPPERSAREVRECVLRGGRIADAVRRERRYANRDDAIEFLGAAEGRCHQKFLEKQEAGPLAALQL